MFRRQREHSAIDKVRDVTAMMLIGDAVMGLLMPERHVSAWRTGSSSVDDAIDSMTRHPNGVRAAAALELAAGLWVGGFGDRLRR